MKTKKNRVVPKLRFPEFYNNGEWKIEKLESITHSISSGKDNKASNGDYPLYGSTGIIGETDEVSHVGSYILVARVGANAGLLNFVTGEFGVSDNTLVVSVKKTSANINFIYYFLTSYRLNKLVFGSGQPLITGRQLKSIELGLPNIEEQQKIADCLSSLDDLINAENEQLDALQEYKAGLLQQLFPAEGETTPKLRFAEFKDDGDWEEVKLGDLCKVLMCKRIFADQTNTLQGVPFYKIGTLGSSPDAFISQDLYEDYKNRYNFPKQGEVLLTCSGTVGKTIIYDGEDAYYQDSNIVWLDNPMQRVKNELLYYIINNVNWGILNSTTITRIYGDDLRRLNIQFPSCSKEQQKIVDCLSSLDNLIQAKDSQIDTLKNHKQGLMQQLFPTKCK